MMGTAYVPNSLWQSFAWLYAFFPGGEKLYMVGIAAICWAIWKTRNKVTFDAYKLRSPCEIIYLAATFLLYWAGLQKEPEREVLKRKALEMMQTAATIYASSSAGLVGGVNAALMITGA